MEQSLSFPVSKLDTAYSNRLGEWILFRWFFVGSKMAGILREEWNYRTPVW